MLTQELQENVRTGSVSPSALVNMSVQELADAKLKAAREISLQVEHVKLVLV